LAEPTSIPAKDPESRLASKAKSKYDWRFGTRMEEDESWFSAPFAVTVYQTQRVLKSIPFSYNQGYIDLWGREEAHENVPAKNTTLIPLSEIRHPFES
jgi:hypothetical protein